MKILVVGCGSIGQRHIRNILAIGHEVSGCEQDFSRAREIKNKYGIDAFTSLKEALKVKYDAAFVCVPTSLHIPISIELARKGIDLFIEKPLSNSLKEINKLNDIVKKEHLVVLVGCNLVFLPNFKQVKRLINGNKIGKILSVKVEFGFYLPYWHPYEYYRKGYSANKSLGGGIIFDDIHELDLLHRLFGRPKEVFCAAEKVSDLDMDTEDIAEIFLRFKSGTIAQIHLDYLRRTYRRYYEFIGEEGVVVWDYTRQKVELYPKGTDRCKVFQESTDESHNMMYIDEIKYFMRCIKDRKYYINDIAHAKQVLETALACHDSAKKKEMVYL